MTASLSQLARLAEAEIDLFCPLCGRSNRDPCLRSDCGARQVSVAHALHSPSCRGCPRCTSEPMDKRPAWQREIATGARDSVNDLFGKGY